MKICTIKIQFNGIYYHYIFVVICILKLESWKAVADDIREEIKWFYSYVECWWVSQIMARTSLIHFACIGVAVQANWIKLDLDNGLDRNNSCGQLSSCHCHVHGYSSASDGFELVVPSDRVVIFSAKPCRSYLLADFIKRYRYKLILFSLQKMCVKFFSYKFI